MPSATPAYGTPPAPTWHDGTGPAQPGIAARTGVAPDTEAYCREARRLRGRLAGQTAKLQWSLRELARARDGPTRSHAAAGLNRRPDQKVEFVPPVRVFVQRQVRAIAGSDGESPCSGGQAVTIAGAGLTDEPSVPHSASERFLGMVEQRLEGTILRYSQRQALLEEAGRLGIGRFQANLIIAAVQHRASATAPAGCSQEPGSTAGWLRVLMLVGIEALLAAAGWWVVRG